MSPAPPLREHWLVQAWRVFDRWFFGSPEQEQRRRRGREAEDLAGRYLQARGYEILSRNWSCRIGELDLVARRDGRIVVVEVKSSREDEAYQAADRVGQAKSRKLWKLAEQYRKQHGLAGSSVQVDVVEVTFPRQGQPAIRHLEAAVPDRRC